jgi:DNA-binding CsgD family transcriptional regulator/PAS domain-containing protein
MADARSPHVLSNLIGSIYDCVLDPSRWQRTLAEIKDAVGCSSSVLYLFDRSHQKFLMIKIAGIDERYWRPLMIEYGPDMHRFVTADETSGRSIDEPRLMSKMPRAAVEGSRFIQEYLKPAGVIDMLSLHLLLTPTRIASLGMGRNESKGAIAQREIELAGLLLPHLRRAVMISDVLDVRAIERERTAEALDALRCGVVLVDTHATILHANSAAERMLRKDDSPIQASGGKFLAKVPSAARELRAAIKLATQDEASIGNTGLAIGLTEAGEAPILAHVLPLTGSDLRTRLQPAAIAAVFIGAPQTDQDAAATTAAAFGLTPAETRVLASLLGGRTLAATAATLGIAATTAKSHLENIFTKTGVSRQADLMRLATSLAPPTSLGD